MRGNILFSCDLCENDNDPWEGAFSRHSFVNEIFKNVTMIGKLFPASKYCENLDLAVKFSLKPRKFNRATHPHKVLAKFLECDYHKEQPNW